MREVVKQSGPQIIIQSATPIQDGLSTEINKKGLSRNIIYLLYIPSILHNKHQKYKLNNNSNKSKYVGKRFSK